jgi:hypothetical protein
MVAAAEQGVMRLSRQVGRNAELENLLQNLRAGDVEAAKQLLRDVIQQQQASEEVEHLDRARRALEYSSRTIQRGPQNDTSASNRSRQTTDPMNEGAPSEFGEDMLSEHMPGMEDFDSPGSDEGYGTSSYTRQQPDQDLHESDEPASKVEVNSGEGAMRLSYIRYLPMQNDAQVPMEKAVVQYQHAAEEVLTQEHIPRGYRERIKQYFLSLGMVK